MRILLLNVMLVLSLNGFASTTDDEAALACPQRLVSQIFLGKAGAFLEAFPMGHPKYTPWAETYVHYPPLFCLKPKAHMPAGTQHHFWLGTFHVASLKYIFERPVVDKLIASVHAVVFETPFAGYDDMTVLEGGTPPAGSSVKEYYSAKEPVDLTQESNRLALERIVNGLIKLWQKDGLSTENLTVEACAYADLEAIYNDIRFKFFVYGVTGAYENYGFLCQQNPHALEPSLCRQMHKFYKRLYGLETEPERLILMDSDSDEDSEDEEDKFTLETMADDLENIERKKAAIEQYAKGEIEVTQRAWADYHCQCFPKTKGLDALLDGRDTLWLQRIGQYIGTKPNPWLGAVGYGHIPGMLKGLSRDYQVYRFNAAAHTWHPVTAATDWAVR